MFSITSPFKLKNLSLFVRNFSCSNSLKKEFLSREIYFDTLARLLTGKETCVAVCYHRNKLYISSNKSKPEHAKEKIKLIRNIIDNKQLSANYEELLKSATRNTLYLEKEKSRFDDDKQEIKSSKNLSNFLETLKTFAGNQNHNWSVLQKSIEKLFSEIKLLEAENKAKANREWEYLINFHDSVFLVEAIKGKLIDKEMINLLKDQEKIEYVSIEDKEKSKMDAEMKIVEAISKKKKRKMKTKQDCYIGLSKLTCDDCSAVLNIMNQEGFKWKVCGRHGSGDYYSHKWIAPTMMEGREEEIKLWKENWMKEKVDKN